MRIMQQYNRSVLIWMCAVVVVIGISLTGCATQKSAQPEMAPSQIASGQSKPAIIELSDSKLTDALKEGDIPEEDRNQLPWLPKRPPIGMEFEATGELQAVYFEFDKYSLTAQARDSLNRNAEWLKNHPGVSVQIEGHCDERGTLEYNQVLGENRAMSTKKYLITLGIDPGRLYTISYGETVPSVPGHTEEAWAKNRRAEFKIGQ